MTSYWLLYGAEFWMRWPVERSGDPSSNIATEYEIRLALPSVAGFLQRASESARESR